MYIIKQYTKINIVNLKTFKMVMNKEILISKQANCIFSKKKLLEKSKMEKEKNVQLH